MNNIPKEFDDSIMSKFIESAFEAREDTGEFRITDKTRSELQESNCLTDGQTAAICYLAECTAKDSLFGLQIELVRSGIRL